MSFRATWSNLRSFERRLLVGVLVLLFLVVNIVWVWPRFGDWNATQIRLKQARETLATFQTEMKGKGDVEKKVATLEKEGGTVSPEDQANQFLRVVQSQAVQSGVNIISTSKQQTRTNEFFLEQIQTFSVQSREEQLVDFLFNLGQGDSMIRVRDLSLRPDQPRYNLGGNIKLVASYQKKAPTKPTKPAARTTTSASEKTATTKKKP